MVGPQSKRLPSLASDRRSTIASWFLGKLLILVLLLSVDFIERSFLLEGQLIEKCGGSFPSQDVSHSSGRVGAPLNVAAPCLPRLSKILAALFLNT